MNRAETPKLADPAFQRFPKGPKGMPIVGTLFDFARDQIGFFERVSQDYGDLSAFSFVGWPCIYVGGSEGLETVLVRSNKSFVKNRLGFRHAKAFFGQGLLTSEGEMWQRQRRMAAPGFSARRIGAYADGMVAATQEMLENWHDEDVFDAHPVLMNLTLKIVARTTLGSNVGPYVGDLTQSIDDIMIEISARLKRPIVIPDRFPYPGHARYRRAVARIDQIIRLFIAERKSNPLPDGDDMLSFLLATQDESGAGLSDQQLRDEATTMLIAGPDTSAIALSWAFHLLGRDPEATQRACEEIDEVVGTRTVTVEDVARLPFIECIVLETMRLYPPVWIIGREAIEPFDIGDCSFPAGTTVLMCPWVVQRDPRNFESPADFKPERWKNGAASDLPRFAYMPFGGGPRICIGQRFAIMELVLVLTTILQRFTVEWLSDKPVRPLPSFTLRPEGGVWIRLKSR